MICSCRLWFIVLKRVFVLGGSEYLSLICDNTRRLEDTLYLEVTAPIVRPGLAVTSDSGRTTVDFSNVGTG